MRPFEMRPLEMRPVQMPSCDRMGRDGRNGVGVEIEKGSLTSGSIGMWKTKRKEENYRFYQINILGQSALYGALYTPFHIPGGWES